MKSNYERNRFKKYYWILSGLFVLVVLGWNVAVWGELSWKVWGMTAILLFFLVILYLVSYHMLDFAYGEMETVSERMNDVMEQKQELPPEEYKEGSIGILYSSFYKMVHVLQESKSRELNEKIFLRDIISDISHQLKTPLASLNVFVDLLLEDKITEPEKKKQILNEAANQLNRMEWMVLSMLKLARIEARAIQFEKQELLLKPLLLQAVNGVSIMVKERNQILSVDCPEDISLCCDGDWLVEAIINLLKNASDYSGNDKPIRIEVERTRVYVRIYVKDEGPGIPEKEMKNIFKRFYRIHQEVNPNSVGIGLSLTKSIVEGMGGSIHVRSEEGKYTWFVITFVQ